MRALLSVYDKTGIADLAGKLHAAGVELLSSGGTAEVIAAANIPVTDVSEVTGFPAMLGHRVVTLHPKIHGGILADRRDSDHLRDLEVHGLDLIDIVVGNLYPFTSKPSIDLIDIGGPTLLRAAAKNNEYVTVLVDPSDYETVLDEIEQSGNTSASTRRRLGRKAFAHTAAYDSAIVSWFDRDTDLTEAPLPETMHISIERAQDLRYGENPHQSGARYRTSNGSSWWDEVEQHSGVPVSYLNLFDADAAWQLVTNLDDRPACAIIKHANPCGVAVADTLAEAYAQAFACDEMSAFGGVVAVNRPIDADTVAAMVKAAQADVVIAPGYDEGVVEALVKKRKNTRLLEAPTPSAPKFHIRQLSDGYLVQDAYELVSNPDNWEVVTERVPTDAERTDAMLAWQVCANVTSNSIVLAKDGTAWGIGAGQQNRVQAGEIAAQKANGRAVGGACASDAFYPFPDGIDAAAEAGAAVIIQPGGSVNDEKTIAAANDHGIAMIFTGERQFRH